MKRISVISALLVSAFLGLTACSVIQRDTGEVKVIPKAKTQDTVTVSQADTTVKQDESQKPQDDNLDGKQQTLQADTEEYTKSIIEKKALDVLASIKAMDMEKLSQFVHPDKGVRFSPYAYVNVDSNLVFKAEQVKSLMSDEKKYTWGNFDGSGEPIDLTFKDYYKKFVYDEDFINAKEVGYNKIIGKGNSMNNCFEAYPRSVVVEYYFPGFDPKLEGMDWRSLRLVFEKEDSTWYLVGIIHDQWTI